MPYPVLNSAPKPSILTAEPLTHESFAPFGTLITAPLPDGLNAPPLHLSSLPSKPTEPVLVNQGHAIKYSPVSPLQNYYGTSKCPSQQQPASPRMSLFSCFPRKLRASRDAPGRLLFDVRILERHPYTSQTFIPLSTSSGRRLSDNRGLGNEPDNLPARAVPDHDTTYLVIVAPSLTGQTAMATLERKDACTDLIAILDPPDLSRLRAFVVEPTQAVTYAAGTWHAPMVVLGKERIDFVVVQFMNGIEEDDCQFVTFGGIAVDIKSHDINQELQELAKL
ncbi:ureidoglycolate lyase [Emydomyces testavorans]|uniref:Ureidoglycolate lyase n=1 Tax=Emydomyces testavorans TaxID=2070801 RepID=A0AAF0DH33_9EURO|nr:ureidoglycolate lyase [Emydomyces testavorans]